MKTQCGLLCAVAVDLWALETWLKTIEKGIRLRSALAAILEESETFQRARESRLHWE